MNGRSALAASAVALALAALLVHGCGSTPKQCGPNSCQGCCDEAGECHAGTGLLECGGGGEACVACPAADVCKDNICQLWVGGEYDGGFRPDPDAGTYRGDGGYFFIDGGSDAGADGGRTDGGTDGGRPDGGTDAGVDAGIDAGAPDAGVDAGTPDAGLDAGLGDGGSDAGDGG